MWLLFGTLIPPARSTLSFPFGPESATSDNLVKLSKQVAANFDFSLSNRVAISFDDAAAMLGRVNGVAKQLEDEIGTMLSIGCNGLRWIFPDVA